MKSRSLLAFLVVLFSLGGGSTFASCPTPYFGPVVSGPYTWADYTQDQSCYYAPNVAQTSISCFSEPSWSFGSGTHTASASFTIGTNDWVGNHNHWEASSWIDFASTGGTSADRFEIDVDVQHPNNSVSYYTVLFWSGLNGSISSCSGAYSNYFTADVGDTVTVTVSATNSGSANIVVSRPRIFSESP